MGELIRFGYSKGHYLLDCIDCGNEFFGAKRSVHCPDCACGKALQAQRVACADAWRKEKDRNPKVFQFKKAILSARIEGQKSD